MINSLRAKYFWLFNSRPLCRRCIEPATEMTASLIGHLGSSTFRLSTMAVFDIAHGLALLFGIGTKALPAWGSRRKWNNLCGGLAGGLTLAGPSGHTIS